MSVQQPAVVTIPDPSWLEREFFPRMEALVQQIDQILAGLQIGGSSSGQGESGTSGLEVNLPLPIAPKVMAESVIAAHILGISSPLFPRYVTTVAAGGSATLTVPVPSTYVMLFVGAFRAFAETYSSGLTVDLVIDGTDVVFNSYPLTAEADVTSPQYGVVRNQMEATYVNTTTQAIDVTVSGQTVLVKQQEYDGIWVPVFQRGYQIWRSYAEAIKARGLV